MTMASYLCTSGGTMHHLETPNLPCEYLGLEKLFWHCSVTMALHQTTRKPSSNQMRSIPQKKPREGTLPQHFRAPCSWGSRAEGVSWAQPWECKQSRTSFSHFDLWLYHTDFLNSYLCWLLRAPTTMSVRPYQKPQMRTFWCFFFFFSKWSCYKI